MAKVKVTFKQDETVAVFSLTKIQYDQLQYRLVNSLPDLNYPLADYYTLEGNNLILRSKGQSICVTNELSNLILCFKESVSWTEGSDKMSTLGTIRSLKALQSKIEQYHSVYYM